MKLLLNGVAIAAALAVAVPAWAQNAPMSPSGAPAAKAAAPVKQAHHRPMRHAAKHGKAPRMAAGDQTTAQLNREELARISGAAPAPAAPPSWGRR